MRRTVHVLLTSLLVATATLVVTATPAAAVEVGDAAEFRAAWEDEDETEITLSGDVTIDCADGGTFVRDTDTPIVIDGNGFTLGAICDEVDTLIQFGTGAVTFHDVNYLGIESSAAGLFADGPVHLQDAIVAGHGWDAIVADDTTVVDSFIVGNGGTGICSEGDTVEITRSQITANETGICALFSDVEITDSEITDNAFEGVIGSTVTLTDSVVAGNGLDGAVGVDAVVALRSTVAGNDFSGIVSGGTVSLTASTVADNTEDGVLALAGAEIVSSTVADNGFGVTVEGGPFDVTYGTITGNAINLDGAPTLFGTVLADAGIENCTGPTTSSGYNVADDLSCDLGADGTSQEGVGIDPELGVLAGNGGPTETRLPTPTSPLVDVIPVEDCAPGIDTDQRGEPRPAPGGGCDVGSVEIATPQPPVNETVPVIAGEAFVSSTLTVVDQGTWSGVEPMSFSIGWIRCPSNPDAPDPVACEAIVGADGMEYVTTLDDEGSFVLASVSATNADGTAHAESNAIGPILAVPAPVIELDPDVVTVGDPVEIMGADFEPSSEVTLTLFSDPTPLGTVVVDLDGTFALVVDIPMTVAPGEHTVEAAGLAIDGSAAGASAALRVEALSSPSQGPDERTTARSARSGALPGTGVAAAGALALLGLAAVAIGLVARMARTRRPHAAP